MNEHETMRLGIFPETALTLGLSRVICVVPLNDREHIGVTYHEIMRFEGELIKERASFPFSCACVIHEMGWVIAHSHRKSVFYVLYSSDFSSVAWSEISSGHVGVFQIIYSGKSRTIVTIGTTVKTFSISWKKRGMGIEEPLYLIDIAERASFPACFDISILNAPAFDYDREWLFLPTPDGICAYDMDGNVKQLLTKFPADRATVFAFHQQSQRMLSSGNAEGLCLWSKHGKLICRFGHIAGALLSVAFADDENIVMMNGQYQLLLMNCKSRKIACN
jgi:hypothetical protein